MHAHLLYNSEIRSTSEPLLSPGQVGFMNGWGVFSTLRVCNGVLFAYERHYARMSKDSQRMRVPFEISSADLKRSLLALVEANGAYNATLRVAVVRNRGGLFEGPQLSRDADVIAFTAELREWGSGVRLSYVPHARLGSSPFACAKVTSWIENLTWYEDAHARGFDEVVLLNEHGHVSECTSANIFVIEGENVWTPPLQTSGCLPGVTRALLLEELVTPGLQISEREITPSELERSEAVFITSTTRDLLAVIEVDGCKLNQAPDKLERLQRAFHDYRQSYAARASGQSNTFAA